MKKPNFSGEKKKCEKTLFFRREKKNVKNPIFQEVKKKKNFGHFLVLKKKVYILKIFSPEILSIFFFVHEKIFGRKILSVWKKNLHKKKSFFQRVLANFLAFFPKKKKKKFFFFGAPKYLKSLRRTYQVIKESPLRRLLPLFLESSRSQKKVFL